MKIILASQSPRRKELMKLAGYDFEIRISKEDETINSEWNIFEVPEKLAIRKANAVFQFLSANDQSIIIAADTVVIFENKILNKPQNENEAFEMLNALNGKNHIVITGVCFKSRSKQVSFSDETKVFFRKLLPADLKFYIENFKPFDKAGSYGIQDWLGVRIVDRIEGCYFNVMGLPVRRVIQEINAFNIL